MSGRPLTSNHVNYLVWRYLQESGHGEAAVKLQRDWNLNPQSLSFAQHVQSYALVSLVQKGLQYHEIEHSINEKGERIASPEAAAISFFGPEPEPTQDDGPPEHAPAIANLANGGRPRSPRKHGRDATDPDDSSILDLPAQPAAKRNRRSNGIEQEKGPAANGDAMEIDGNGVVHLPVDHATPTPTPEPRVAEPTLKRGSSKAVQNHQVAVLGVNRSSIILDLSGDSPDTADPSHQHPEVFHVRWNPTDPTVFSATGSKVARIYRTSTKLDVKDEIAPPHFVDLLELDPRFPADLVASTVDWSPSGELFACARYSPQEASTSIVITEKTGALIHELPGARGMFILLRWNASGTLLLGLGTVKEDQSTVYVWSADGDLIAVVESPKAVLDAVWHGDTDFTLCGNAVLRSYRVVDGHCFPLHEYGTDESWQQLAFDAVHGILAVAATNSGKLGVAHLSRELRVLDEMDDSPFSALEFQPVTNPRAYPRDSPRRLAAASQSGYIYVWDVARSCELIRTIPFGKLPVVAMSFSPDGYLVAGAAHRALLVWHADEGGMPQASWTSPDSEEDQNSQELEHSLQWDCDGGKIAYGSGTKVVIMNFL